MLFGDRDRGLYVGAGASAAGALATSALAISPLLSAPGVGLRWEIPGDSIANAQSYNCGPGTSRAIVFEGDPTVTYQATCRFRGVIELKTAYTGGVNDGQYFSIGGTPSVDGGNIYELDVAPPPFGPTTVYYLNRLWGGLRLDIVYAVDYTKVIPIVGGSVLRLAAQSIDNFENQNKDGNGNPVTVPGVPPYPSVYVGQFLQMDVVSVTR